MLPTTPTLATVIRVIDGDTFYCYTNFERVFIRTANYDTFEARKTRKLRAQAAAAGISVEDAHDLGKQARDHARMLLTGQNVMLEYHDGTERDSFGRYWRIVKLNGIDIRSEFVGMIAPEV